MSFVISTWDVGSVLASGARINGSVTASLVVGSQGTGVTLGPASPLLALRTPSSSLLVTPPAWWDGQTPSRSMTWTGRRPARFFQEAAGAESSGDEFGILEDERCIDTGVFQDRYLLHAANPCRGSHKSNSLS